jgi:hypothetical protein
MAGLIIPGSISPLIIPITLYVSFLSSRLYDLISIKLNEKLSNIQIYKIIVDL